MASKNVKGLIVQIDGDTKGLSKALNSAEKQTKTLSKELKDIDKLLKFNPASVEGLTQKKRVLAEAIQACADKMRVLQEAQERYQEKIGEGNEDEHMRALKREIEFVSTKMGEYEKQLVGANTALATLSGTTEEAREDSDALGDSVDALNTDLDNLSGAADESADRVSRVTQRYNTLRTTADNLSTRFEHFSDQLGEVNSLLKTTPKNVELLRQKKALLSKSIDTAKQKLEALKTAQAYAVAEFKKGNIAADEFEDLQYEISKTTGELEALTEEMKTFGSVAAQQIKSAGENVQNVGSSVEKAGQKLKGVSMAAAGGLTLVSKEAIDFESAWAGVTKTVNESDEDMEKIKQGILDLAQSTASSAEDIAAVTETAGQLGVKGSENLLTFTETMVRLGDSTNLSAEDAASAIARIYNIMGSDLSTVGNFGAAMVDLGNNFATTEDEILEMATRLASAGNQMGMSEQEVLALATTLSSVGMKAEAGGSAISQIMIAIDKAVATNSDTLKTWAGVTGLTTGQFKDAWENDAMGALQLVMSGLGDASKGGENLNLILEDLDITTIRQTDTMRRLSSASGLLADAVETSNSAWSENNALTIESDKRYETTAAKIQQLKGTFTELCVQLGEILLPIIQSLVDGLKSIVEWFSSLDPTTQKVILTITALVATLGPVLIIIGKIISAVGTIMTYAPMITTAIGGIRTAVSGLFGLIAAHPIIAIITAIVGAVIYLWNNCEWFRDMITGLWEGICNLFSAAWEWIQGLFAGWGEFWSGLWDGICNVFSGVGNWFSEKFSQAAEWAKNAWNGVTDFFGGIWDGICNVFSGVGNWFSEKFSQAAEWAQNAWSNVTGFFGGIWDGICNVFSGVGNWFSEKFSQAAEWTQNAWANITDFFGGVWDGICNIFSTVDSWFGGIFSKAWEGICSSFASWGEFFSGLWEDICNVFSGVWEWFKGVGKNIVEGLWNGIVSMGEWLWDKLTGWAGDILGWVGDLFGIHSPSRVFAEFGKFLDMGLAQGIEDNMSDPIKAAQEMANGIIAEADNLNGLSFESNLRQRSVQMAAEVTAKSDNTMLSKLDKILVAIEKGQVIALDSKQLVGSTANMYDNALGQRRLLAARGAI